MIEGRQITAKGLGFAPNARFASEYQRIEMAKGAAYAVGMSNLLCKGAQPEK